MAKQPGVGSRRGKGYLATAGGGGGIDAYTISWRGVIGC